MGIVATGQIGADGAPGVPPRSDAWSTAVTRRRLSRPGIDTRGKLLDAAERLFAENGYDGTSLRDITNRAKQHLALCTYHFGTKERLFEEVIQRRAAEMEAIRLAALHKIEASALTPSNAVLAVIEAYSMPMIRARYGASKQWQAHVRLLSQLISVKRWVPLIQRYYDTCGLQFIAKLQAILPDADHNALLDSFSFMISNMLYVCSYTNRFEKQKMSKLSANEEIGAATENFLQFAHAGFMACSHKTSGADAGSRRSRSKRPKRAVTR